MGKIVRVEVGRFDYELVGEFKFFKSGVRPSVLVRLTDKGEAVRDMLRELFGHHLLSLEAVGNVAAGDFETMNASLKRLERFWIDQVRFRL